MTVTSLPPGARAPRRRAIPRVLTAVLAAALTWGVAVPAFAQSSPAPTATAASATARLIASPGANGVVRAGQPLTVAVTVRNPTASDLAGTAVSLQVGDTALADRSAMQTWIGAGTGAEVREIATTDVDVAPAGSQASTGFVVAADDPALAGRAPGVYPVRVSAANLSDTTVLVVPAESATATAVVVPITAGTSTRGVLSSDTLARLTGPDGDLTAQLDAVQGTAAVLAVDPAIPAAIRVLGTAAPTTASDWLDRLLSLPNARFALQFADADVSAQLRAGVGAPLQPTSLGAYMDAANFIATGATPAPGATTAPGQAALPDLAQLTGIGTPLVPDVFWPTPGSVDTDVLSALQAADAASLTLVPSDTVSTPATRASVGAAQVLVYDSAASSALTTVADEADAALRGAELAIASAELAFATSGSGDRPLVVAIDRGTGRDRAALRGAIGAVTAPPVALDALAISAATPVEVQATLDQSTSAADVTALLADEDRIAGFATILEDPTLLTGPQRAEILQVLSVAWSSDQSAAQDAVAAHRAASAETLDAVGILATDVTLASYGSELRPYVRNDLPYPVTLVLVAHPDDPRLIVEQRTTVTAQPSSNTRVEVPVQAQVGNGTVTIDMQLYSAAGVAIGASVGPTVEVHAEWETIGLVVLIVLMVLFLGLGIIRTVRRRRARTSAEDEA